MDATSSCGVAEGEMEKIRLAYFGSGGRDRHLTASRPGARTAVIVSPARSRDGELGGARQHLCRSHSRFAESEIGRNLSGTISAAREKGNFVVDGPTAGGFFIQASMPGAAGMFLLHNVPGPYWKFSGFLKSIRDASIQREAMAQRCWLSVDLVRKSTSDEDADRFVEQVVGKLAPPDAAFLVHPSKFIIIRFDDELRARLTRGERILPAP